MPLYTLWNSGTPGELAADVLQCTGANVVIATGSLTVALLLTRWTKSWGRALRGNGGILLIRTPVTDSLLGAHDLYNDPTHKWAYNHGVLLTIMKEQGFAEVLFRDERPVPYKLLNWLRLGLFQMTSRLVNAVLISTGLSPVRVWSTSGWFIGRNS